MQADYPFSKYNEEELKQAGIYRIYRIDGDPSDEYIGQAIVLKRRWARHLWHLRVGHNTRHLQRAWDKYGADAFDWEVLEFIAEPTKARLDEREQWYLSTRKPRYNLCYLVGRSRLGVKASPETRAKMREAQKDSRLPAIAVENSVAVRKGKRQQPEHVAKRAASLRSHGMSDKKRAWHESRRGVETGPKPLSVRMKISQAKLGTQWSAARRAAYRPHTLSLNELTRLEAGHEYQRQRSRERDEQVFAAIQDFGWQTHVPMYIMTAARLLANRIGFSKDSAYRGLKRLEAANRITIDYDRPPPHFLPTSPLTPIPPRATLHQGTLFTPEDQP